MAEEPTNVFIITEEKYNPKTKKKEIVRLKDYVWMILLELSNSDTIIFKATHGNNLNYAERIIKLFTHPKISILREIGREFVTDISRKTGDQLKIWVITLKKKEALIEI